MDWTVVGEPGCELTYMKVRHLFEKFVWGKKIVSNTRSIPLMGREFTEQVPYTTTIAN